MLGYANRLTTGIAALVSASLSQALLVRFGRSGWCGRLYGNSGHVSSRHSGRPVGRLPCDLVAVANLRFRHFTLVPTWRLHGGNQRSGVDVGRYLRAPVPDFLDRYRVLHADMGSRHESCLLAYRHCPVGIEHCLRPDVRPILRPEWNSAVNVSRLPGVCGPAQCRVARCGLAPPWRHRGDAGPIRILLLCGLLIRTLDLRLAPSESLGTLSGATLLLIVFGGIGAWAAYRVWREPAATGRGHGIQLVKSS